MSHNVHYNWVHQHRTLLEDLKQAHCLKECHPRCVYQNYSRSMITLNTCIWFLPPVYTHALLSVNEISSSPLFPCTHTVINDYLSRYIVPPTLYPIWWWPVRKRPKHVVGTLLYIQI